jgi:hypothetical protein
MHVAPSQRLHRSQVEDEWVDVIGCIGTYYPYFVVFILLGPRGIVVISLLLESINRTLERWSSLPLLTFSFPFSSL